MAAGLLVAEGTRRSNMSRLRAWLGSDAEGEPYLPDAYSGRIRLDAAVSSDSHQLRLLLGEGVDQAPTDVLELALREAVSMRHNYIGTEHILLGLVREGDVIVRDTLVAAGVDPTTLRAAVAEAVRKAS